MAFIFVPNADGGFTEGDKQTNPDTGVEYAYIDGAWRALGPKIEDEFDTLDDRYIKLNGRSDVGDAYTIKGPGETAGATSTFHQIKDGKQYLYHVDTPQDSNTEWVANVSYVKSKTDDKISKQGTQTVNTDHWKIIQPNQDGNNRTFVDIYDGSMNLYNVVTPSDSNTGWAANVEYVQQKVAAVDLDGYATEQYVDDVAADYLPLTGGVLSGTLESQLIKSTKDNGYAFEVKPNNATRASWSSAGRIDIYMESMTSAAIRTIGTINVKSANDINGANSFIAHKDYVRVIHTASQNDDVLNKKYADDKLVHGKFKITSSNGNYYVEPN